MRHVLGQPPGKIIAVHVNYRSRAAERGRLPAFPSYFLKPATSVGASDDPVVRPRGCELLAFEGEIALVIGTPARHIDAGDAWEHVRWVTAANDFGVYDLRYADAGSNLRSKGIDGYTPLGPRLIDARGVDPAGLRVRTWVDGDLAQDALSGDEVLFGFDRLVADLSRLTTLEPGDVILTGTPTGSTVVDPGAVVEVEVTVDGARSDRPGGATSGRLRSPIVDATEELASIGAMPRADDALRAMAHGGPGIDWRDTGKERRAALHGVATATLASQLRSRGLNGCTLDGLRSSRPDLGMVGTARTVSYLPLREDLFEAKGGGLNAQKRAVEAILPGEVLVIAARGDESAGTIGDILALRAERRGASGIVTDGSVRDSEAVSALGIPTYHAGTHSAVLGRRHVPWETDVAVACAGVLVQPGDLLVGDADGVVVVPDHVATEVAAAAKEQERKERFIAEQVAKGASVAGLYPIGPDWAAAYAEWSEVIPREERP